jgi:hypothetical protein
VLDLVAVFAMADLAHLHPGSTTAELVGSMVTSQSFGGSDGITFVPFPGPDITIHDDGSGYSDTLHRSLILRPFEEYTLADCVSSATDQCGGGVSIDATGEIVRITSDEPSWIWLPWWSPDMVILGSSSFAVRREALLFGNGRVYTIHFTVNDAYGNATPGQCRIQVKKHRHGPNAVDSGVHACIGSGC